MRKRDLSSPSCRLPVEVAVFSLLCPARRPQEGQDAGHNPSPWAQCAARPLSAGIAEAMLSGSSGVAVSSRLTCSRFHRHRKRSVADLNNLENSVSNCADDLHLRPKPPAEQRHIQTCATGSNDEAIRICGYAVFRHHLNRVDHLELRRIDYRNGLADRV